MQPEGGDPHGLLSTLPLRHSLPLRSAMATVGAHANASAESHELQRMEPPYTNYTAHFVGTLDYMFYTYDRLSVGGQPRSREIARDTPRDAPRDTPRDTPICRTRLALAPRAAPTRPIAPRSIVFIHFIYLLYLGAGLLEMVDDKQVQENTALPSAQFSSDHVPLLCEYHFKR